MLLVRNLPLTCVPRCSFALRFPAFSYIPLAIRWRLLCAEISGGGREKAPPSSYFFIVPRKERARYLFTGKSTYCAQHLTSLVTYFQFTSRLTRNDFSLVSNADYRYIPTPFTISLESRTRAHRITRYY
ncbi:hypothetical protein PUN28_017088 [Cardiocondyla obscurior]|uniref:Secreted protein n=1 Tax=Cardiocondyla obscurior TaxID=286306 RepID=A0AAW2ELV1_9HYME